MSTITAGFSGEPYYNRYWKSTRVAVTD